GSLSQGASNQPPSRPSVVSDVNSAFVNTSISFQGVTQDPEGDSISYRFHWGDGNSSGWSPYKASGESETLPHTFTQQGVYNVVVEARDRNGGVSEQSPPFAIQISPVGSLFWHDFNADAPGLFPADPPWTTIQTSPSYLRVVNDVFFGSSGNSCAFYDFDPDLPEQETGAAYIYAQIRSNSQGSIEFAWRIADAQDAFGVRAWEEFNFTKLGYYVLFWNGQISYYENQTFKSIQVAEAGRWYTMKLDFNVIDRVYDIYVDGALKVSGVSFAGDSTNTLQLLQVVAFNDAQCRTGYIDDIRISGGTLAKVPAGIRPRVPESAARLRP
ncbi:MAG: PKD domain-containing protein, partial [Bacteroidetes bacterium]|nr:PKD domain-containing protein [Bacteroidota bacterium]